VPRRARSFVDGGIYHVYCRISRGEPVFGDKGEAARFVGIVADVKRRDDFAVLAWCVMANHYHLAIRSGSVPLWRSIRLIQWRYAIGFNRRRHQLGPLWQSRYHARLVEDERYLYQLIAYIHLNPVAAGIVDDPAAYRWSGHAELLRRTTSALADADVTLALFGAQRGAARRAYVRMLRGERTSPWLGEGPGRLPWWSQQSSEEDISGAWDAGHAAPEGRPERMHLRDVGAYLEVAAAILGTTVAELGGRGKLPAVARAREILTVVGVERFGVRMKEVADRLGMNPGSVSHWAGRGAARRTADEAFARRCLDLERAVSARLASPRGRT
jgi:putative transposase